MLINVKMPSNLGILTFMSMINFNLTCVVHEFFLFYNLGARFNGNFALPWHIIKHQDNDLTLKNNKIEQWFNINVNT